MDSHHVPLSIAYLHYGEQSGVTLQLSRALRARGHAVTALSARGPLELRDATTRMPRFTRDVAIHLALAALAFRRRALSYRWNTGFAFDVHSRHAGRVIAALRDPPDVVLQNGALFAPGLPPHAPYVLMLDHTRALAEATPVVRGAGLPRPPRYGKGWHERERACYAGASGIATFSENVARSLERDYGVARSRVHVVGAGANVFPGEVVRRDDGDTILFVGREFGRKGGPVLLDAFERLRRKRPRARLVIVGPEERLALPDGAESLGPVPYDGLEPLFSRATVFALPTLQEPFGIAFLDAMACGVPCVGTQIEAVPEIIEDGRTGLLVPPADPIALADALECLLADPDRARALGAQGRARVAQRFLWQHVADRLLAVLLAAAGREVPRSARTA
jgi:glycosyltransferase involved in cell wall biosynthesis